MQVAKASTTIVKRAMTVIFQTVTKAVTTIAQFLAPFTMAIIVGAVTMALFIVIFAGSSASAERCSTDYVFSDLLTDFFIFSLSGLTNKAGKDFISEVTLDYFKAQA